MIDCSRPFELIRRIGKLGVCLEQDDCLSELNEIIEHLVKERDAALEDLKDAVLRDGCISPCNYCKHLWKSGATKVCSIDSDCYKVLRWEWRGVQDD